MVEAIAVISLKTVVKARYKTDPQSQSESVISGELEQK
jgi:hypothetical protein